MGEEYFKRPLNVKTEATDDIKADRIVVDRLVATTSQARITMDDLQFDTVTSATSAQTLGAARGMFSLESTSTGDDTGIVFELPAMSTGGGDLLGISVGVVGATSAPVTVVATTDATFDGTNDVMKLGSSQSGALLVSQSTARWLVLAVSDAAFAAAT